MSDNSKGFIAIMTIIFGGVAMLTLLSTAEVVSKTSANVTTYQLGETEWGYTITSAPDKPSGIPTFLHSERGFASNDEAIAASKAYIDANINPKVPKQG